MVNRLVYVFAVVLVLSAAPGNAAIVRSGFFSGMDMVPMQGASMRQIEQEPAAVLLFTPEAASIADTAKYDKWFRDPNRPRINAYAVSIGPEETPFDVIAEVLRQRELQVPTFHIRGGNLLPDKKLRFLLLDNGGQVRRAFEGLDLNALETELGYNRPASNPAGDAAAGENTEHAVDLQPTEPLYRNNPFRMQVEFPPHWSYRVARSNDGAVAKSPETGRIDLRIWALPDKDGTVDPATGAAIATSPNQYIEDYIAGIAELNQTRVNVDRRLVVEDDDAQGRDCVYSYNRLIDPDNPSAGSTRYRGRIQVFVYEGLIKAAGAEGPVGEFDTMVPGIIDPFFLSFHPRLEPTGSAADSTPDNPAGAVPTRDTPDGNSSRVPSSTRYF